MGWRRAAAPGVRVGYGDEAERQASGDANRVRARATDGFAAGFRKATRGAATRGSNCGESLAAWNWISGDTVFVERLDRHGACGRCVPVAAEHGVSIVGIPGRARRDDDVGTLERRPDEIPTITTRTGP